MPLGLFLLTIKISQSARENSLSYCKKFLFYRLKVLFVLFKDGIPVTGLEFKWEKLKKKLHLNFDKIQTNGTG